MDLGQFQGGQVPEPEEERQGRLAGVLAQAAGGVAQGFLNDVRVIHPARQAAAESEVDHSARWCENSVLRASSSPATARCRSPEMSSESFLLS